MMKSHFLNEEQTYFDECITSPDGFKNITYKIVIQNFIEMKIKTKIPNKIRFDNATVSDTV